MRQDDEIREYVRFKTSRLMSVAAYRKLKTLILAREREEHGKSIVVSRAVLGLLVLFFIAALIALGTRRYAGYFLFGGFFIWIGFVVLLMRRHLGTHTGEDREA